MPAACPSLRGCTPSIISSISSGLERSGFDSEVTHIDFRIRTLYLDTGRFQATVQDPETSQAEGHMVPLITVPSSAHAESIDWSTVPKNIEHPLIDFLPLTGPYFVTTSTFLSLLASSSAKCIVLDRIN